MSNKDYKWRSLNHVIGAISKCDVILKCENKYFVGPYEQINTIAIFILQFLS